MLIIYLPGYSAKNKAEGESIVNFLGNKGLNVYFHQWPHWQQDIDFDKEAEKRKILREIERQGDSEIIFIAKSIGTVVSLLVLRDLPESYSVPKMIMLGIPADTTLNGAIYREVLPSYAGKLIVIQNEFDNIASSAQIAELLVDISHHMIVKAGIDTHRYDYPEEVWQQLQ